MLLSSHISPISSAIRRLSSAVSDAPSPRSGDSMVKFSKELEAELIPEWKDAFVDYWKLKKHVKKIKLARKPNHELQDNITYDFGRSTFDPIRLFLSIMSGGPSENSDHDVDIIQVKCKMSLGENGEEDEVEIYETELVQLISQENEVKMFFEMLDEELNKVNHFYKARENEFMERGLILNKQLQILLDLKRVLDERRPKSSAICMIPKSFSGCNSSSHLNFDISTAFEKNNVISILNSTSTRAKWNNGAIRIQIPATTPARTIAAVTSMLWEDLVINNRNKEGGEYINRKKIKCAEKMIRGAFVELYKGLCLLKKYRSLNMVAFVKILKKFDKVSSQETSLSYLKVVKGSYFISSNKVMRLMEEVETLFTDHFAKSDRKMAMKFLRIQPQTPSHFLTFLLGVFTGCFVTLFSIYAILAHISGMFSPQTETAYMETVYPIFSMFALLSLHLFMYGCNMFMWTSTRINYKFIFDFESSTSTALNYRDVFLICTSLMTAVVGAFIIHLVFLFTDTFSEQAHLIPAILLLFFILLLVCPFNICYRSTRVCFLRVMRNIICSPFYKVLMMNFFMADQLTSQIPLLRHMESAGCYFLARNFKTHRYETCKSGKMYRELAYVISFAPYYWRAMQCVRRWFDECDLDHLANLGKYVSAMVAAWARLTYSRDPSSYLWMGVVLVTSFVTTIYQLYWDCAKDWGFFDSKSKNPWLRDDLMLKSRGIYYASIAFNLVLRVAWVESVMRFDLGPFESRMLHFFLASLEVIRRGHWNFYRLENEHLNNVGKFRAVKIVPLPFHEMDSDG